jgi:hypothetical protein
MFSKVSQNRLIIGVEIEMSEDLIRELDAADVFAGKVYWGLLKKAIDRIGMTLEEKRTVFRPIVRSRKNGRVIDAVVRKDVLIELASRLRAKTDDNEI